MRRTQATLTSGDANWPIEIQMPVKMWQRRQYITRTSITLHFCMLLLFKSLNTFIRGKIFTSLSKHRESTSSRGSWQASFQKSKLKGRRANKLLAISILRFFNLVLKRSLSSISVVSISFSLFWMLPPLNQSILRFLSLKYMSARQRMIVNTSIIRYIPSNSILQPNQRGINTMLYTLTNKMAHLMNLRVEPRLEIKDKISSSLGPEPMLKCSQIPDARKGTLEIRLFNLSDSFALLLFVS